MNDREAQTLPSPPGRGAGGEGARSAPGRGAGGEGSAFLSLIAAVARGRVIGKDNRLLWHLPEDMQYFRATTRGKPVIMGRKTWESLPEKFRPLPGRHNLVVSRNPAYAAPGATLVASLEDAIARAGGGEIFVIGGETLYRQALPLAQRLYLTEIDRTFVGDAFFPEITAGEWQEISRSKGGAGFDFVVYTRAAA